LAELGLPRSLVRAGLPNAVTLAAGLEVFELPMPLPETVISATWNPRLDANPTHRWLRETFNAVFRETLAT